jgi:hypothetical protein
LQGEEQKKLDVLSNEVFVKALVSSGRTVSPPSNIRENFRSELKSNDPWKTLFNFWTIVDVAVHFSFRRGRGGHLCGAFEAGKVLSSLLIFLLCTNLNFGINCIQYHI